MNELNENTNHKPRVFCIDELLVLKERYTDEELHGMWNIAFQFFLKDNNSTTDSKDMPK